MASEEEFVVLICERAQGLLQKYKLSNSDRTEYEQFSLDALAQLEEASHTHPNTLSDRIAEIRSDVHLERLLRIGLKTDADAAESGLRALLKDTSTSSVQNRHLLKLLMILNIRYQRTADMQNVWKSVALAGNAIATATRDDPCLPGLLGACGLSLLDLSDGTNSRSALDMAVEVLRAAKDTISSSGKQLAEPSTWVFIQQTLAEALRRRFEATGDERDIAEAQAIFDDDDSDAVLLPREVLAAMVVRLRVLHSSWRLRPEGTSLKSLLQEYSQVNQLLMLNDRNPICPELYQATGVAFNELFFDPNHNRRVAFASILSGYRAGEELLSTWKGNDVAPGSCSHSPGLAPYLFAMGRAWELQFHGYYSPEALGAAHAMYSECLALTDPKSSHYALRAAAVISAQRMKRDLGFAGKTNSETDEFAISILKGVLLGGLPLEAKAVAAVATELGETALYQHNTNDSRTSTKLDQAIRHFRKAVFFSHTEKTPELVALKRLAEVLTIRAKDLLQRGLKDPAEADCIEVLGILNTISGSKFVNLQERYDTLGDVNEVLFGIHSDPKYAEEAIEAWRQLYEGTDGVSIARLMTATKAAALQQRISGDHEKAARVFRSVILTFLQVISPSDTRPELIWKLRLLSRLNTRALSEALLAKWPVEEVLGLSEQCRSVIWNTLLSRKASVRDLEARHRALATRFEEVRSLLARASKGVFKATDGDGGSWKTLLNSNQFSLAVEYDKVLAEIRQQPGFEDFLRSGFSAERLRSISTEGPVVMFVQSNVTHALIVSQTALLVEPLPNFDRKSCEQHYKDFKTFLELQRSNATKARETLESLLHWLWDVAAGPVISAMIKKGIIPSPPTSGLESVGHDENSTLPRVWWASSGWINVFPIHVAGEFQSTAPPTQRRHVFNYCISSYTPSLGALEYSRSALHRMSRCSSHTVPKPEPTSAPEALLVSMKFTPDVQPDLDHSPEEIRAAAEVLLRAGYTVTTMGHPKEEQGNIQTIPTRKTVVKALRTCEMAHFACHGVADLLEPVRSKLLLWDWKKFPLTVGFLMRMDLQNCRLVNLSACDVAVNRDLLLREEGLHVAGAFQMAGVPAVLGSMWPVGDRVAPRVSRGVYKGIVGGGGSRVELKKVAEMLHRVTMELWRGGESVVAWGPYVHFGA